MSGILEDPAAPAPRLSDAHPRVVAEEGLAVLHRRSGLRGQVERVAGGAVVMRDAGGRRHQFRNLPGAFAVAGETVTLTPPGERRDAPASPDDGAPRHRSAAGALVLADAPARVARASRLWVEGDHDALLVERIWGDDLRELGIVVESIGGVDNLAATLASFAPGPRRRVVVLVDHLVAGSREWRVAEEVGRSPHVHVVGHREIDVWACVRPERLGIAAWPEVPRGEDWKTGVCRRLGWGAPREGWRRVLGAVDSFADVFPDLVGAVEQALDLLTVDDEGHDDDHEGHAG